MVSALFAACPNLPTSAGTGDAGPTDADGADAFVPLSLERVVESTGPVEGGLRVAILGAGLLPNAQVRFGLREGLNVLVLEGGQLNVDVPAGEPGLVDVTVVLPDGQSATLTDAFLYRGPLEAHAITPALGPATGQIPVTVTGAGFGEGLRVFVGDRALEDVVVRDPSTLVGTLPARLEAQAGVVDVVVSDGFEQRVLSRAFRYVAAPRVDWLSPASGSVRGGTEVTLYGRGLAPDTTVTIGGAPAEVVVPGHGEALTVRTPPGAAGVADVVTATPLGPATWSRAFTYVDDSTLAPTLSILNAWPSVGSTQGGLQVALTVAGLEPSVSSVSVTFGGAEASVLDVRPAERLVVVVAPEGAEGPALIRVAAGGAEATRADLFRFEGGLEAEAVEPSRGSSAGGTVVRVAGTGFGDATVVTFGGRAASVRKVGAGFIEVATPPGAPGRVDVVVEDGGRAVTLAAAFGYEAEGRGRLWAVTPGEGARAGGRVVRIHGEGFVGASPSLFFGGQAAEGLEVIDDALLLVRDPQGDVGEVNVSDPFLGRLAMAYRYFNPAQRYGGASGGPLPEALNVTVLDQVTGRGVDQAYVILWDDLGTPYQGVTDERGQITFSDVGFGPMQMVTASKDLYTTSSIVDFDARDATLLLIPLVSSPPSSGGGGGPQPLPNSTLTGRISGLDKYVLPPPGSCDNRLVLAEPAGLLCQPCVADADCGGAGALCTDLGEQGRRCTTACVTDAECPTGYGCKAVGGGVQCVPSPGPRSARCSVTLPDVFSGSSGASFLTPADPQGVYSLTSRPGEYAVVCLGGYEDELGTFFPTMMGVRRHVFAVPGDLVAQQDVVLDIPLNRDLRVRLDDAPLGDERTALHTVDVFVDFGADGVYRMPSRGRGREQNLFSLTRFPARFAESLYDASYTVYATAVPDVPDEFQTGEGSFVVYDAITETDGDTVLALSPGAGEALGVGVTLDVHALTGDGTGRLWGACDEGRVVAFDGTLWGLGQAPTDAPLRGVWARSATDVWAVGDAGAVMRWDSLRWRAVDMPAGFEQVAWRGVQGVGDAVWLWGDAGVWRHDGLALAAVPTGASAAAIRGIWTADGVDVWGVGEGGLIRRWRDGVEEVFDAPGADLFAVHGQAADDVWAVGDRGRVVHWNGTSWFDLLPVTARALHRVHAVAPDRAWAVGDAGVALGWDGLGWSVEAEVAHTDLRAVWGDVTGSATAAGLQTLVIGPFLRVPRPENPSISGALRGLDLRWDLDPGPAASFTWLQLQHSSGFPFWSIMAEGLRRDVPLPDLKAAWGLEALWPGSGYLQIVRAYLPDFSFDAHDNTLQTVYAWRSWVVATWPLEIPETDP